MVQFARCVAKYSRRSPWSDVGVAIQFMPTAKHSIFSESVTNLHCENFFLCYVMLILYLGSYQYFISSWAVYPLMVLASWKGTLKLAIFVPLTDVFISFFKKGPLMLPMETRVLVHMWFGILSHCSVLFCSSLSFFQTGLSILPGRPCY